MNSYSVYKHSFVEMAFHMLICPPAKGYDTIWPKKKEIATIYRINVV